MPMQIHIASVKYFQTIPQCKSVS